MRRRRAEGLTARAEGAAKGRDFLPRGVEGVLFRERFRRTASKVFARFKTVVVNNESVEEQGLKTGQAASAAIKSSGVIIAVV